MYKRVEEIAEGKIGNEVPVITFAPEHLIIDIIEGANYTGSFTIKSINGEPMKGIVYSSDMRMEVLTSRFSGTEVVIRYEFHGSTLKEGDVFKGCFNVITNGGEYNLEFVACVKKQFADSSVGRITSIDEFVKLYKNSWREAMQVFGAPAFSKVLKNDNEKMLHRLLSAKPLLRHNVEEFLIGCGYKDRVKFSLEEGVGSIEINPLTEIMRDYIAVNMSGWGYGEINVSCDCDFIIFDRENYTSEDFTGGMLRVEYTIDPAKCHGGKNYGRVIIEGINELLCVEVCAVVRNKRGEESEERALRRKENLKMMRDFNSYRAGNLILGSWADETIRILLARKDRLEGNALDSLWCGYVYIKNGQLQQARWILEEFKNSHKEDASREYSFYLFLLYLLEKEPSLKEVIKDKISARVLRNEDDVFIKFIALEMQEDSRDSLVLMEHFFLGGDRSPILYALAAEIYLEEPYLLLDIGSFELQVLVWMCKNGRINKDMAAQINRRVASVTEYNRLLDYVLSVCYQKYPETDSLSGICAYRIRGQRYGKDVIEWYRLAIEYDLKLTGLYEAFMYSVDAKEITELPKQVQLYFMYNNQLDYKRKAVLYVNIIAGKNKYPDIYERYLDIMIKFAYEQILLGHIDDNLSVVYDTVLKKITMTTELANALAKILYMNRFVCLDRSYSRIIVLNENFKNPGVYTVMKKEAYIPIYSGAYVILLEDDNNRRFTLTDECRLQRLFNPGKHIRTCLSYAPSQVPYLLQHMNGKTNLLHLDEELAGYVRTLVDSDEIADSFKAKISPGFLEYSRSGENGIDTRNYLLKIDYNRLESAGKDNYLENLIKLKMYSHAFSFIVSYGPLGISGKELGEVIRFELEKQECPDDKILLFLAKESFDRGSRDKLIVEYLCNYYGGLTKDLIALWEAAVEIGIECEELEEKILIQLLFSTVYEIRGFDVFESYITKGGRDFIKKAFLTWYSYQIFVNEMVVSDRIYTYIERAMMGGMRLGDYCKIALLDYYSTLDILTQDQIRRSDRLITHFIVKNLYFKCFLSLPMELMCRHHFYDLAVVEYRTTKKNVDVYIKYRDSVRDENFKEEKLNGEFSGIYFWHGRLSPGGTFEYYIIEKTDRSELVTESRVTDAAPVVGINSYSMLKELNELADMGEDTAFEQKLLDYEAMERVKERMFKAF